jgi:hypothetical protein
MQHSLQSDFKVPWFVSGSTILSVICFFSERTVEFCPDFRFSAQLQDMALDKGSVLTEKVLHDIREI